MRLGHAALCGSIVAVVAATPVPAKSPTSSCAVTDVRGRRPPDPATPSFNYGNAVIRVALEPKNGRLVAGRLAGGGERATINEDGSIDAKFGWWRAGSGKIRISGAARRVGTAAARARPVRVRPRLPGDRPDVPHDRLLADHGPLRGRVADVHRARREEPPRPVIRRATLTLRADVAELVDAHGSGPCALRGVESPSQVNCATAWLAGRSTALDSARTSRRLSIRDRGCRRRPRRDLRVQRLHGHRRLDGAGSRAGRSLACHRSIRTRDRRTGPDARGVIADFTGDWRRVVIRRPPHATVRAGACSRDPRPHVSGSQRSGHHSPSDR